MESYEFFAYNIGIKNKNRVFKGGKNYEKENRMWNVMCSNVTFITCRLRRKQ